MDFVSPSTPPGVGLNTVSWLLLDIGKKIMIFDNNNNKGQIFNQEFNSRKFIAPSGGCHTLP